MSGFMRALRSAAMVWTITATPSVMRRRLYPLLQMASSVSRWGSARAAR